MDEGRVRFWQGSCLSLALALAIVLLMDVSQLAIGQPAGRARFTELDVERINVMEADGTVKLVIANRERAPDQRSDGRSSPRSADNKLPGITFFDDAGDEAGGLKIRGDRTAGPSARRHLLFDQQRGDQVLGLISDENEMGRTAGMTVWDRPDVPLVDLVERYRHLQAMAPGPERSKLQAEFDACCAGFGATRVFLGKTRGHDATLALSDANGRERLRLVVTPDGDARVEFLNEQGRVSSTLPSR